MLLASTAAAVAASAGAAYLLTRVTPVPAAALALTGQGQESLLCGMAWRAMKQFEQALLMVPDMPGTRAWLAWSWLHLDQPERARTLLRNSRSATPVDAVVKALLALDAKSALRAATPPLLVPVLHFYLEDSPSAAHAIRQGSPPFSVALARAMRHEHDLNNASFNAERTGHAEQAWQVKLLQASFKLPRSADQDASQIFLQLHQAAEKFANPEMLIRSLGLESAREWLTGSEARGAELALEIETQAQSAQVPYLAAIVLADLTDRLYGAGRVLDADFYAQRAHIIGYPVQAFASCGRSGMFNTRILRYEGDERRSAQSRDDALRLLARSGNPALYARLTSATR